MPGVKHLYPQVFPEHLASDGDAPEGVLALPDVLLLPVPLPQVTRDQLGAVGRIQLKETPHLEQSLVLWKFLAVEEHNQDLEDVQQSLEVAGRFLTLQRIRPR